MLDLDGRILFMNRRGQIPARGYADPVEIALTAYAGDTNQQQVIAAGFQKHISKPIEPEELVQAIVHLIRST